MEQTCYVQLQLDRAADVLFKQQRTLPYVRHYYEQQGCHGRCTVYEYQGKKLLIDERFLPAFVESLLA